MSQSPVPRPPKDRHGYTSLPRVLTLMQGIPGSGKSRIAEAMEKDIPFAVVLSTDEFWGPKYRWNPDMLGPAHLWNQARAEFHMFSGIENIIIDNTNLSLKAVTPYLELAAKHHYSVQIVRIDCPLELAFERNARRLPEERRIPEDVIRKMYAQFQSFKADTAYYRREVAGQ